MRSSSSFVRGETDERFLFVLARELSKTVGEITDPESASYVDWDEFMRWKALYRVEAHERTHDEAKRRAGIR